MPNQEWVDRFNETPRAIGAGNRMPAGARIDPWNLGLAGLRLIADRALSAIDGFGIENLSAAGVKAEHIQQYRAELAVILTAIVRHNGRNPSRRQARAAAMRLLGHLRIRGAAGLLAQVLQAPHELPTQRAAAADAIGFMRERQGEKVLLEHLNDPHPAVQRSVAAALGWTAGAGAIAALEQARRSAADPAVQRAAHEAIRRIEQRLGREPSLPPWQPKNQPGRGATRPVKLPLPQLPALRTSGGTDRHFDTDRATDR